MKKSTLYGLILGLIICALISVSTFILMSWIFPGGILFKIVNALSGISAGVFISLIYFSRYYLHYFDK